MSKSIFSLPDPKNLHVGLRVTLTSAVEMDVRSGPSVRTLPPGTCSFFIINKDDSLEWRLKEHEETEDELIEKIGEFYYACLDDSKSIAIEFEREEDRYQAMIAENEEMPFFAGSGDSYQEALSELRARLEFHVKDRLQKAEKEVEKLRSVL